MRACGLGAFRPIQRKVTQGWAELRKARGKPALRPRRAKAGLGWGFGWSGAAAWRGRFRPGYAIRLSYAVRRNKLCAGADGAPLKASEGPRVASGRSGLLSAAKRSVCRAALLLGRLSSAWLHRARAALARKKRERVTRRRAWLRRCALGPGRGGNYLGASAQRAQVFFSLGARPPGFAPLAKHSCPCGQ